MSPVKPLHWSWPAACGLLFGLSGCASAPPVTPQPGPWPPASPILSQGGARLLGKAKQPSFQKSFSRGVEVKTRLMLD
jgi:hypothetical protein